MPIRIEMPRLSDTMEEGTLVKWRVGVGDKVASGDVLADVETDKATMELQAFDDGTVASIAVDEGQTAPVGTLILLLAEEGESVEDAAAGADAGGNGAGADGGKQAPDEKAADDQPEPEPREADEPAKPAPAPPSKGRIRVSPLARRLAEEKGVDLASIRGSGPDGRIIKRDVLEAAEGKRSAHRSEPEPAGRTPLSQASPELFKDQAVKVTGMRRTIAKRLVESKTTIPHFTVTVNINADPLMDLRATLNEQLAPQGVKLSVNDFIVRAAALGLVQHPHLNASWAGDTIHLFGTVNIGVAVALPVDNGGGLVVPVIRNVQDKGLRLIGQETRQLAEKARTQGLSVQDMADGTFTISNLGMFNVEHFEAIINPPQAGILAVGGAITRPVVRDGQIMIGREMSLTLSADHRAVDGAMGAAYLQSLKQLLENPGALLV